MGCSWYIWISAARSACLTGMCLLVCVGSRAQTGGELRVAAAADLTRAFTEAARVFEKQTGQKVSLIFGSSGQLEQQIENGAPFDVFASANQDYVARLDQKTLLLSDTQHIYATGKLVLWTRANGPDLPATLADLANPRYARIAIANPQHAPYGLAAKQALEKAGIWTKVQSKLVTGENIQQTFQFVTSGNADIALVSRSLTTGSGGKVALVPNDLYAPLRQAIAVLRSSSHAPAARRYVDFILGRDGQAILRKYGFEQAQENREKSKEKSQEKNKEKGHVLSVPPAKSADTHISNFLLSSFSFALK